MSDLPRNTAGRVALWVPEGDALLHPTVLPGPREQPLPQGHRETPWC